MAENLSSVDTKDWDAPDIQWQYSDRFELLLTAHYLTIPWPDFKKYDSADQMELVAFAHAKRKMDAADELASKRHYEKIRR